MASWTSNPSTTWPAARRWTPSEDGRGPLAPTYGEQAAEPARPQPRALWPGVQHQPLQRHAAGHRLRRHVSGDQTSGTLRVNAGAVLAAVAQAGRKTEVADRQVANEVYNFDIPPQRLTTPCARSAVRRGPAWSTTPAPSGPGSCLTSLPSPGPLGEYRGGPLLFDPVHGLGRWIRAAHGGWPALWGRSANARQARVIRVLRRKGWIDVARLEKSAPASSPGDRPPEHPPSPDEGRRKPGVR